MGERMSDSIFEGLRPITWFDYMNRPGLLPGEQMSNSARQGYEYQARIRAKICQLMDENAGEGPLTPFGNNGQYDVAFSLQDYIDRFNPSLEEIQDVKIYIDQIDGAWHSCVMANLMWERSGKNVVCIGENMQKMMQHTKMTVRTGDFPMKNGETVYIALPGFDGKMFDHETGYHLLRGIFVSRQQDRLAIGHWGKPKLEDIHIGTQTLKMWSDTFMTTYVDLTIDEEIETIYETMMNSTHEQLSGPFKGLDFNIDQETFEANMNSMRIAVGTIMYWKEGKTDHVHPLIEKYNEQLRHLERFKQKKRTKKKQREFEKQRERVTKKAESMRGWFYIDPPKIKRAKATAKEAGDQKSRKSPHSHIRSGHFRTYKATGKTKWIKPMIIIGSGEVPAKWWKTRLDGVVS